MESAMKGHARFGVCEWSPRLRIAAREALLTDRPLSSLWSAPLSVAEAAAYNDPPTTRYTATKSVFRISDA